MWGKLPTGGPYVVDNSDSWAVGWPSTGKLVGNGDCIILVETAMGWTMPVTDYWRQGELVKGDNSIKKGTVIATFDENGRGGGVSESTGQACRSSTHSWFEGCFDWSSLLVRIRFRTVGRHASPARTEALGGR
jgi:hypothetical protein